MAENYTLGNLAGEVWSCWWSPKDRLNLTDAKIGDHVKSMRDFIDTRSNKEMNDWIVENLNTLDRKAQGLLLLNAIVLTIATIIYPDIHMNLHLSGLIPLVITIAVLIYSCISVAILNMAYWTSTREFQTPSEVLLHLVKLRDLRTRIIWNSTFRVIVCLLAILALVAWNTAASH